MSNVMIQAVGAGGGSVASIHDYWHFVGVFHPAIVHFPIALLMVAGLVEFVQLRKKNHQPGNTAFTCLWMGAIAAVAAAMLGWALADATTQYDGRVLKPVLTSHRWLGVAVATLGVMTAVVATVARQRASTLKLAWTYRAGVLLTAGLTGLTGMFGGQLTFGPDHYDNAYRTLLAKQSGTPDAPPPLKLLVDGDGSSRANDPESLATLAPLSTRPTTTASTTEVTPEAPALTPPAIAVDLSPRVRFAADVKPIFEASCVKCHGATKRKGGYRLDEQKFALGKGDTEDETPIIPGDSDGSLMVKMLEGKGKYEEQQMPPDDPPLTGGQIATIRKWIDQGAEWTN